jgi:hypothetical protein
MVESRTGAPRNKDFDSIVPNPERFREGMFQDFPFRIKCLLSRGGIAVLPRSESSTRIRWRTFQARSRLCFDDSNSSSRSWIAFGVTDTAVSVHTNTLPVKTYSSLFLIANSDFAVSEGRRRGAGVRHDLLTCTGSKALLCFRVLTGFGSEAFTWPLPKVLVSGPNNGSY